MAYPRRSTNERVLARHHLKRIPVSQFHQVRDVAADTHSDAHHFSDIIPNLLPETPAAVTANTVSANTVPAVTVAATTTPVKPTKTVLPPIGRVTTPVLATTEVAGTVSPPTIPNPVTTPSTTSSTPVSTSTPSVVATTPTSSPSSSLLTANGGATSTSGTAVPEVSAKDSISSQSSHGVSPAAIGVTVSVLVVILIVLAAIFVRKRYQRRRAVKRNTWGAGLVPSLENKRQSFVYGGLSQSGRPLPPDSGVPGAVPGMSQRLQTPTPQPFGVPPPLGSSPKPSAPHGTPGLTQPSSQDARLSTPMSPFVAPSVPSPSVRSVARSVSAMSAVNTAPATAFAVVARTFIPSLPDELHISNGEQIRVTNAYDDGWALCVNTAGEQGVVPLECLERWGDGPVTMQLQPQSEIGSEPNRTSRRMSSLSPNTGTY